MQAANKRRSCKARFAEVSPRRIFSRRFYLLMFVLALSIAAAAQTNHADAKLDPPTLTSSASSALVHTSLTYRLQTMFGLPLTGISVEVHNLQTHSVISSANTGQDGSVAFRNLPLGRYEVTIAGGILSPRREVQVDEHDTRITVELPLSPDGPRGNETVSVQQLTIPRKAREALAAANEAWEKGNWKKVREQATLALTAHPDYGAARAMLGFLDLREGNLELACAELKQAIENDPNSALAYLALGSVYNSMKQYDAALSALSVFPSVSSDKWQLHYEIARAYIGLGKYELGLRQIDYAQRLAGQDPVVLRLGKAHALLGLHRNSEAATELEAVLHQQPNGPFSSEAEGLLTALRSQIQR